MPRLSDDEAPDLSNPLALLELPPPSVGEPRVLTVIAVDVETYEHFRSRGGDWQAAMADTLRGAVKK
jgi:uncharacterized protein (DUF4415 family)